MCEVKKDAHEAGVQGLEKAAHGHGEQKHKKMIVQLSSKEKEIVKSRKTMEESERTNCEEARDWQELEEHTKELQSRNGARRNREGHFVTQAAGITQLVRAQVDVQSESGFSQIFKRWVQVYKNSGKEGGSSSLEECPVRLSWFFHC